MKGKDDMERTPFFLVIGKGDRTKILVKGGEDWCIYIYICNIHKSAL